jgi:hypothetical protein
MIRVKWLKAHSKFAYSAGDLGMVTPDWAEKLVAEGYIIPIPGVIRDGSGSGTVNPLPEDLPGRDILFTAGFDTPEKVKDMTRDDMLDAGVSKSVAAKISKYFV